MRITIAVDAFAPIGGSERYAIDVARELGRAHVVTVVTARAGAESQEHELVVEERLADADLDDAGRARLLRTFAATRPDVVFALTARSLRAFLALGHALPVVRFVQDHVPFCPGSNKTLASGAPCESPLGAACLRRWLGRGCHGSRRGPGARSPLPVVRQLLRRRAELGGLARCAGRVVASEYMREELVRAGLARATIDVVPYFTRLASDATERGTEDPLDAATRAFVDAGAEPWILAAGRFAHPDKGFDHLIAALARLERPARCVIAGDGPARARYEDQVRAAGLARRVHLPGWLSAAALARLYAESALVAFPSTWNEPFGLVGIEAAACGRPVVAYDVGGVGTWLTPGRTGRLVPRGDRERFARELERLLRDPDERARLGRAARAEARRRFAPERHVERLTALFERVAARAAVTA